MAPFRECDVVDGESPRLLGLDSSELSPIVSLIIGLVLAGTTALFGFVGVLSVFGVVLGTGALIALRENRRRKRMGLSICTFARSFPRRAADPWVVRAVWEYLQDESSTLPLPEDALDQLVDVESLAHDFSTLCRRTQRDASHVPALSEPIRTVGDLVSIISALPRNDGLTWARAH